MRVLVVGGPANGEVKYCEKMLPVIEAAHYCLERAPHTYKVSLYHLQEIRTAGESGSFFIYRHESLTAADALREFGCKEKSEEPEDHEAYFDPVAEPLE